MAIDPALPFRPVNIALLAVSDTRTLSDDTSGNILAERITGAGHVPAARAIVPDDVGASPPSSAHGSMTLRSTS